MVFDRQGQARSTAQQELAQHFPKPGWVEHDPGDLWESTRRVALAAVAEANLAGADIAAVGIANQRETTLLWERSTGRPLHRAIVWQDRRTADRCRDLDRGGAGAELTQKTGLLLDPYFSATKIAWILDRVPGARDAAAAGHIAFGTVDSFLIWRLTGGRAHLTDASNASRTALYDIRRGRWDQALCEFFDVPMACLPEVRDTAEDFGLTDARVLGRAVPIRGVAGDQQAALVGQACFSAGDAKSTYGTGAFLMLNTAKELVTSKNRLLGTIAYRLRGETTYALEGSILSAGSAIQWLRDGLGIIARASDVEPLAASVADANGVYLVPAFTGLGAPYWDADARGALLGLTRASGRGEIARAALDSVAYQTYDLLDAMASDGLRPGKLQVDGGMAQNGLFMQRLADVLGLDIQRPQITESTAFGAACLAGLGSGIYRSLGEIAALARADATFTPSIGEPQRQAHIEGWRRALRRVR